MVGFGLRVFLGLDFEWVCLDWAFSVFLLGFLMFF